MSVENLDHIYVDDNGILRDSYIEHLFDELHEDKIDALTQRNFVTYNEYLLGACKPGPEIFTEEDAAFVWVSQLGQLEVGETADLPQETLPDHAADKAFYALLTNDHGNFGPVFAPTEICATLLSVVQMLRYLFIKQYQRKVLEGNDYDNMN